VEEQPDKSVPRGAEAISISFGPFDERGQLVHPNEPIAQTHVAVERLKDFLTLRNLNFENLIRVTVFVVGDQDVLRQVADELRTEIPDAPQIAPPIGAAALHHAGQAVQFEVQILGRPANEGTATTLARPQRVTKTVRSSGQGLATLTEILLVTAIILGLIDVTRWATLIFAGLALVSGAIWTLIEWLDLAEDPENVADAANQPFVSQLLLAIIGVLTALLVARLVSLDVTNGSWGELVALTIGASAACALSYVALRYQWKKRFLLEVAAFEATLDRRYSLQPLIGKTASLKSSTIVSASLATAAGAVVFTGLLVATPALSAASLAGTWSVGALTPEGGTDFNEALPNQPFAGFETWTFKPRSGCNRNQCSYLLSAIAVGDGGRQPFTVREVGDMQWQGSFWNYSSCGPVNHTLVANGYLDNDTVTISLLSNRSLSIVLNRHGTGTTQGFKQNCTYAGEQYLATASRS
jgi:enamine deaminase RidA (YjgF/YER057c/UK114 family)